MRTVGLIVEYNPFHNGHSYHLQQSLKITEADAVVAVMSGNFLQRGEPALVDKWTRTRMALAGGCDLVIELPVAYATQAAEWFAYGAVSLLESTGVVDAFCFGTESGQLSPLRRAAELAAHEPEPFKRLLKERLDTGVAYPQAYSGAIAAYLAQQGDEDSAGFSFDQPNHTLGLHYLIAHRRLGSRMEPYTIAREKADYNQTTITDVRIASATAIRKLVLGEGSLAEAASYVPTSTCDLLAESIERGLAPVSWDNYIHPLLHGIVTRSAEQLSQLHELAEGLEYRLLQSIPQLADCTFESLLEQLKTKRYTRTKLQRALLSVLLGHAKDDFTAVQLRSGTEYIRVLGFTDKGRELLRRMKRTAAVPVLMSAARPPQTYRYLELDTAASAAYWLGVPGASAADLYRDFRDRPIIV
ncbi:nucleotidyltransferase [Paenibacillus agaridevorans]|uniref:tRNA(Met) cytidine acetate ligase n=1 Tax=Paenibacillus agaridevorans TaxID=171404 RepID=A0A2R5F0F2_9BACL|nr:nucleotidyltransferase [Paenibacillus agaridevorans]GBG09553.1 nucleotidyltransferase [Paenibacillus agaridevorans]